jgi:hypothetical protein
MPRCQSIGWFHLLDCFGPETKALAVADQLGRYVLHREREGAARATIRIELALLGRAFTLAMRAKKLRARPYIRVPAPDPSRVRQGLLAEKRWRGYSRSCPLISRTRLVSSSGRHGPRTRCAPSSGGTTVGQSEPYGSGRSGARTSTDGYYQWRASWRSSSRGDGRRVGSGRSHLTPITYAAARNAHEIVERLRDAGAAISVVTSVYLGDRRAVAKANLIVDEEGTPLLLHAAQSLNAEIVGDLLDRGANTAATDRLGKTALHRVADLRRTDGPRAARVAVMLIERGAPVDGRNRDGVTPLHQAVRARNLALAEVLLDRGANPNAPDKRGSTPLHRASASTGASNTAGIDPAPFIELLLGRGADPKQKDKRGRSALSTRRAKR